MTIQISLPRRGGPWRGLRLAAPRFAAIWLAAALLLGAVTLGAMAPASALAGANVGDPAPDFTAENLQDTAPDFFQLSSYRGSIVVLEFFAYW